MPILFVLALIVFAVAVVAALSAFVSRDKAGPAAVFLGALILGFVLVTGSAANSVPVRSVGIVTSFNKPTGEVTGSGLQWVKPWEKVGEWDASRQKYDHIGGKNAVSARSGTGANVGVEVLIEWQVKEENAPQQFLDYKKDFDLFKNQRVGVQLDSSVNDAFADYNPLAGIDAKTGTLNLDLKPYQEKIKTSAEARLGNDIKILSVTVTRVNHDPETENRIKAFADKLALGRNLDQDKINAVKQAEVTQKNATADKVTRCLEIAEKVQSNPGLCLNPGIVMGTK
jgi:uncharacterized protein YerC